MRSDVYPLYWTTSKEGIFMRYSYEYKRKCVEMYREGRYMSPGGLLGGGMVYTPLYK